MPKNLKRLWYKIINPIRKCYWFIFRPQTRGVKCIIEHNGKILFVQLGYAHKSWTIPGGGVGKKETFEQAIRREIKEEVGIDLNKIQKIGEYVNTREYKVDTVECFKATVDSDYFKIDNFEIVDAVWATFDNPPVPYVVRVRWLKEFFEESTKRLK